MDTATITGDIWSLIGALTTTDIVIIVLVVVSMVVGFMTGFVWQFVRIASLVASIWVSWIYHPVFADALSPRLGESSRLIASAGLVFMACLLTCYLLAYLFRNLVNALKPEMTDRLLGAVFGVVKGALLVGAAAFLVIRYMAPENPVRVQVENSRGAVAAATCVRVFLYALPDRFSDRVTAAAESALKQTPAAPQQDPNPEDLTDAADRAHGSGLVTV